jgi:hypothetical protein
MANLIVRREWRARITNHEEHEGHEEKGTQESGLPTYMKLAGVRTGLLIDLDVTRLNKRFVL